MPTKRDVMRTVFSGGRPPYVPWHFQFTHEAREKLLAHFGSEDALEQAVDNHILELGSSIGFFEDLGGSRFRDVFGVTWNRTIDKDIGIVEEPLLKEPTLDGYEFPDPLDDRFFRDIEASIARFPDRFRVFYIGFSLFERAWTLRGMENLLLDMYDEPEFVHELLGRIADYDVAQARHAMTFDIDAIYHGDDWGQQHGLIMGPELWDEFIRPQLRRMYGATRAGGRFQMIHSCGDVSCLFDRLVDLGLNCFNPFQPEVTDTAAMIPRYRGRLAFHGGLSTQRTLPFGTEADVRAESRRLLELGREGGYVFAPGHAVEGDVPLANMLAFIDEAHRAREAALTAPA